MQEELNQFIANDVWELVSQPKNMTMIGTKWVFRNKLDENGVVSRNKARLVAQCYNQQKGIDYDETYAPIARLESIRILLAYARALDFKLFQMDVKSAFLNGLIKHIKIRHYFLRDNVQKGHISIEKVASVDNIADILTKPLKRESFNYLCLSLGMMEHIPKNRLVRFSFFCLNSSPCSIPCRDNLNTSSEVH
ncbi:retrovirus-related pol polyprotein from transposon TNT 1-94 [Tanacetum coccineum]